MSLDKNAGLAGLLAAKPKAAPTEEELVGVSFSGQQASAPVVLKPNVRNVNLASWATSNAGKIETYLQKHGGVLFRGFELGSVDAFQEVVPHLIGKPMAYTQRSSPRSAVKDRIYTSTDYPADQCINMHNELSYAFNWPLKIAFFCLQPAPVRGETPIADSRTVLGLLGEHTRKKFAQKGIMYVRNLTGDIGMSWQEVFQTEDRRAVEEYCAGNGMDFEWKAGGLVIRWVKPAVVVHPKTGEPTWFNHGYFFNYRALDPSAQLALKKDELPYNTCYGDGSEIEPDVVQEINYAYRTATRVFSWEKGDLLLLDNMLMAHGRNSYEGERRILVAMGEEQS